METNMSGKLSFSVELPMPPVNVKVVERLAAAGVTMEEELHENTLPQTLAGLTFVLTGSLVESGMTRTEAGNKLKEYGAKVSGSVSKKDQLRYLRRGCRV